MKGLAAAICVMLVAPAWGKWWRGEPEERCIRMRRKPPKLGQIGRLKPKTPFPARVEASALSQKGVFGYNRPEFPGSLGKIGYSAAQFA